MRYATASAVHREVARLSSSGAGRVAAPRPRWPARRLASVVLSLVTVLAACAGEPPAPAPPDATYRVRGEIVQLPSAEGREILIRHEAIPELKDAKGEVVGMESMTMPFTLAADVDRSALAEGQRIEFTLEVRWDARDPIVVRELVALPAGTRLGFERGEGERPLQAP